MRPAPRLLAVLTVAIFSIPASAAAQAVCSAPHSAPSLSASGSITTLEPGSGWVLGTFHRVQSNELYGSDGTTLGFLGNGEATTTSAFLTGAIGLTWGLELWAQIPMHALNFDDVTGTRERTGLGDPRLSLRIGSELFTHDVWPVSIRAGVKFAGSEFPVDASVLPLAEGQVDYEVAVESGWSSFGDLPIYALGWVGYRWRTEETVTETKPGNELYAHLAVGGILGSLRLELGLDALDATAPERSGILFPASARQLVQLTPTIGWSLGAGSLELGAQIPISGRNLPTGSGVSVGYLLPWGTL